MWCLLFQTFGTRSHRYILKRIFISRKLEPSSAFAKMLDDELYEIHDKSLVEFSLLPFKKTPQTDWTFFYSKQGIRFFFENIDSNAYLTSTRMRSPRMPSKRTNPKYAAFGAASAKYLKETQNIDAHFVGSGEAVATSKAFLEKAKGRKVLFVRGTNSRQSVQELIGSDLDAEELIAYDNQPKKKFKIPACDFLVFTSPMNAQAYYKRYKPKKKQMVFAIGPTTAVALLDLGIDKMQIAAIPSEQKLAELVRSI